jgi:diguanylate cyclase (GGDEF)-like protein
MGLGIPVALQAFARDWITPVLRRPMRSLPSRIIVSVFAAALVTSLVVTWLSTRSIESFLRAKIDQQFPASLRGSVERLDLWYAQRELDLKTFADSAIVEEGVEGPAGGPASARTARGELAEYLTYVLERFPQYDALFVLDREGRELLHIGADFELPAAYRRSLADIQDARVSDVSELAGRRVQVASAAVVSQRRNVASLHALVRLDVLEDVLRTDELGTDANVYVVSQGGDVVLRSQGSPPLRRHERPLPPAGALPAVEDYTHPGGTHVVGSAMRFPRFAWSVVVEQPYDEAFAPVVAVIREILVLNLCIVLVFGLIAYQIARSIVRPIQALSDAARRIAAGEAGVAIPEGTPGDEIGLLTRAFNDMSRRLRENQQELEQNRIEIEDANARLIAQNQELHRVNEVFQQLSITDELTRLHNHRFFQEHLPREIKRSERTQEPLSLVLIDIDDFKTLNDRFGHAVGDAVLRKVADVMHGAIREMDLLARYGGEEFALLAANTTLDGCVVLAEKIRLAVSRTRFSVVDLDGPKRIAITASFGVAQYHGDEKAFFNDADRALYRAKAQGKDCVVAQPLPPGFRGPGVVRGSRARGPKAD